ncbi:MAG: hypothetical protein KDA44_10670 [Planctomycetales bacterium]|nr:hypothetical protein [Planctomycetales bacterium]
MATALLGRLQQRLDQRHGVLVDLLLVVQQRALLQRLIQSAANLGGRRGGGWAP